MQATAESLQFSESLPFDPNAARLTAANDYALLRDALDARRYDRKRADRADALEIRRAHIQDRQDARRRDLDLARNHPIHFNYDITTPKGLKRAIARVVRDCASGKIDQPQLNTLMRPLNTLAALIEARTPPPTSTDSDRDPERSDDSPTAPSFIDPSEGDSPDPRGAARRAATEFEPAAHDQLRAGPQTESRSEAMTDAEWERLRDGSPNPYSDEERRAFFERKVRLSQERDRRKRTDGDQEAKPIGKPESFTGRDPIAPPENNASSVPLSAPVTSLPWHQSLTPDERSDALAALRQLGVIFDGALLRQSQTILSAPPPE